MTEREVSSERVYRHKKRGTEYVLIGNGKMQAENWVSSPKGTAPVDMREVVIYRSATDPTEIWVRPREEFEDGRFEALPNVAQPVSSERVSEERLKLWFFRDLSSEQRLKLFGLLGMPVEEIGDIHGHQTKSFRHMLLALRSSVKTVGVKKLEWSDDTKGQGCPIRFAAWPLHGYRIHLYQYGERDTWAVTFGSSKGVFLPERGDADFAKRAVEEEWRAYLDRALILSARPSPVAPSEVTEDAVFRAMTKADDLDIALCDDDAREILTAALKGGLY